MIKIKDEDLCSLTGTVAIAYAGLLSVQSSLPTNRDTRVLLKRMHGDIKATSKFLKKLNKFKEKSN